jgi:hypothetical protein
MQTVCFSWKVNVVCKKYLPDSDDRVEVNIRKGLDDVKYHLFKEEKNIYELDESNILALILDAWTFDVFNESDLKFLKVVEEKSKSEILRILAKRCLLETH